MIDRPMCGVFPFHCVPWSRRNDKSSGTQRERRSCHESARDFIVLCLMTGSIRDPGYVVLLPNPFTRTDGDILRFSDLHNLTQTHAGLTFPPMHVMNV